MRQSFEFVENFYNALRIGLCQEVEVQFREHREVQVGASREDTCINSLNEELITHTQKQMKTVRSMEKSRLSVEIMGAMLIIRQTCVMECERFWDRPMVFKDQHYLLLQITSLEKYSWCMIMAKYSPPLCLPKVLCVGSVNEE